jgi:hypothetical protein
VPLSLKGHMIVVPAQAQVMIVAPVVPALGTMVNTPIAAIGIRMKVAVPVPTIVSTAATGCQWNTGIANTSSMIGVDIT